MHLPSIDVVCSGDPYEMGHAQGVALRERIRFARRQLAQLETFRLQQPRWMPYHAYRFFGERKAAEFLTAATMLDSGANKRLRGIASGADLPFRSVCLFNALEPLLSSVGGCTACPGACSAVAATGRRTPTGEAIVARNFDYLPLVQPFYTIRESCPAGALRSLEFTTAPMAGVIDGMNEAGLCIIYNYAFTEDAPERPATPISLAISAALARCRTVAEAANQISSAARWGGALLMLADANGGIASLELSSAKSRLRWPEAGADVIFHSNAFATEEMRAVQIADDAIYTNAAPSALRGRRLHESSDRRDARFRELIDKTPILGTEELATIMADHGANGVANDFTPCIHGAYWHTTACLQFYPRARRVRVSYGTACMAEYCDLSL